VKHCNCIIENNAKLKISNKHNAVVFFKNGVPVRLLVAENDTNIDMCVNNALAQQVGKEKLQSFVSSGKIICKVIDLCEKINKNNFKHQIDVGSCDRKELLEQMLKGCYTEDNTNFGNFDNERYTFDTEIKIIYSLKVKELEFYIEHEGAFINETKTRIIPIQKCGKITEKDIIKLGFC
ncbi:MAG: hypothetical protein K2K31_03500, partial [Clostridia bacterium]|nr:hypothetical protein [Clostridia bacterium]